MKQPSSSVPLVIPPDIAAKCDGPDQFGKFDRLVRNVLAIPPKPKATNGNGHVKKRAAKKR